MTATATPTTLPLDHPEFAALWATIEATPEDAAPMLVAADWCDEHEFTMLATALRARRPEGIKLGLWTIRLIYTQQRMMAAWHVDPRTAQTRRYNRNGELFGSLRPAIAHLLGLIGQHEAKADRKAAEKAKLEQAKAAWVNPYKVGQLLYHSWGYDQTNYDFAQIVAVGKRSVTIRRIKSRHVRSVGWGSDIVAPDRDNWLGPKDPNRGSYGNTNHGDPQVVSVKFSLMGNGTLGHSIGWSECGEREEFNETSYA